MDFKSFAKQQKKSSDVKNLIDMIDKQNKPNNYNDDRYWKLTVDKNGNGSAIIRFLPEPFMVDGEDAIPFVKYNTYNFQGIPRDNGKTRQGLPFYSERSLLSLGLEDPVNIVAAQ